MKDGVPAWSVVALVTNANNDILAITRGFNPRDPALPGGDSEPGDASPAQTVLRELFEETGIKAAEAKCLTLWGGERGQRVFGFFIPRWSGRLRSSSEGKPFWTQPRTLLMRSAYYRKEAETLLMKMNEMKLSKTG